MVMYKDLQAQKRQVIEWIREELKEQLLQGYYINPLWLWFTPQKNRNIISFSKL